MINIDFMNGTVEDYTVVLAHRNLDKQGQILNIKDFNYKGNLSSAHEISFSVYKEVDGEQEKLWNDIYDLKLVWIKEEDKYFQIQVSKSESSNVVKKITGTSLGEAELSQTQIRNTEINTELDIDRDNYVVTKFFNPENPEGSLLHRILSVVPHYSIKHVDRSLWDIQRTFSIDGTSVYDFLVGECAEQIGCLFQFNSNERSISVYDLNTVCNECGHRGEYFDYCPECGSDNLKYYGEDTTIFVSIENLTDEITFDTDVDAIKNCFKLKTGDDIMDAAVISCNPNGSAYIYYFSEEQKADMPEELRNGLNNYDNLVESYSEEYQTLSKELYECIDKILYYQSEMMPDVEIPEVNATTEAAKLTVENLSPIGLSKVSEYTTVNTVNSALKNFAKVFVKSGFVKLEIETGEFTYVGRDDNGFYYGNWTGRFKVTNYSDEEDVAYSETLSIRATDDYDSYLNQKILKNISSNNTDDDSVFKVLEIKDLRNFKKAIELYCYKRLESFADAIQGVINVLIEENQGRTDSEYYQEMYAQYYNKLEACQEEMDKRSATIKEYEDRQEEIIKRQTEIQKVLDMKTFLGDDLYKLFCSYRREDTYQNENFISDGLSNEEIFKKAEEFIEYAKNEIVKSGEHQHSISSNLHNLLLMEEFKPIKDKFDLGNWIRIKVDDVVYRLRLVTYEISGNSLSNINTEFAELTKTSNGVNDIRSILSKAQSMASSYSYISKQAEQGKKAQDSINGVINDGLNSALINIKNNENEEITYDKYGILCKTWDDIAGDYNPEQLRITHNLLVYSDDAFKSCKTALGKHDYYYYDNNKVLQKETGYGLDASYVSAGYVWGSQVIGGEIYSENYSLVSDSEFGSGTYFDLNKGSFSLAGGRLIYNGEDELLIRGVSIKWESIEDSEEAVAEITKRVVDQDYVNDLEITAVNVSSTDGVDKCDIKSGYVLLYKDNVLFGGVGANSLVTSNKELTSTCIKNYSDLIVFSQDDTPSYIINPSGCELTEDGYNNNHLFIGTGRFTDTVVIPKINMSIGGASIYGSEVSGEKYINIDGGLSIGNDLMCNGDAYKIVKTESDEAVNVKMLGSTKSYIIDFGNNTIGTNGSKTISIDSTLLKIIDTSSYQVFITPTAAQTCIDEETIETETGYHNVFVDTSYSQMYVSKKSNKFIVYGKKNVGFSWMICAKQKE
jgi:hypothetical protein